MIWVRSIYFFYLVMVMFSVSCYFLCLWISGQAELIDSEATNIQANGVADFIKSRAKIFSPDDQNHASV